MPQLSLHILEIKYKIIYMHKRNNSYKYLMYPF